MTDLSHNKGGNGPTNGEPPAERIVEPHDALPPVTMADLSDTLRAAASNAGWTELMPVQTMAIPYILAGRDLMVQSRTGSGKTGAFVLPLLEKINPGRAVVQSLILVPTRELARQVATEAQTLCRETSIRIAAIYGGVGYGSQRAALEKGAHIVVGTPGRILDHLLQRTLTLTQLSVLVFDEADRMMSMGFYPDMKKIQSYLPSRKRSGFMFSATFPHFVVRLASEFLHHPEMLSLSRDRVHVVETEHVYYEVPPMEKDRCLVRVIEMENPTSAIIFCNTKAQVHYVTVVLQRFGYNADELSADLSQTARERVMKRIRDGSLRLLVATDLAARGIDIPELSHVIQYDTPEDPEAYIHRAGRTSRAGEIGEAISLVAGTERISLLHIAKKFDIDLVKRDVPTSSDVRNLVSERVTALLESKLRQRDKLQTERMERFIPLARELGGNEDEVSLIAMLIDDYYQQSLGFTPVEPHEETKSKSQSRAAQTKAHLQRKRPSRRSDKKKTNPKRG